MVNDTIPGDVRKYPFTCRLNRSSLVNYLGYWERLVTAAAGARRTRNDRQIHRAARNRDWSTLAKEAKSRRREFGWQIKDGARPFGAIAFWRGRR
jgi:hypothetical protein